MFGPVPKGMASGGARLAPFQHLRLGETYRVIKAFADFDGALHPVDETWVFLGHHFIPYDDGLSLFVSLDGEQEWQIRLQWRPEAQADVIDRLGDHIAAAS